jgi:MEDS: MEthanogen/methylotroph, DcmR Sensory domain
MLGKYRHICAFFSSPQEEYATLLPFIRDGIESGERAYHVLPAQYRQEHLDQLAAPVSMSRRRSKATN